MCDYKIDAVVVTYKPNFEILTSLIDSISNQVSCIYVINNGTTQASYKFSNVVWCDLGENKGIAHALNVGLRMSLASGSDFVLISDQDTIYPAGYINNMLSNTSSNDAAIAPRFHDQVSGSYSSFYISGLSYFIKKKVDYGLVEISQAISSGLVVSSDVIRNIGGFREDLFIDWVDFEWCWKVKKNGYNIVGNANVIIEHRLGDTSKKIGNREIGIRSPLRHYYITRNAFYLAIYSNDLCVRYRIVLFFKSFRYILAFPLLVAPRAKNLKAVLLGFLHGLKGKLGKFDLY
ncbi:glycosyltransferase family 2 protein [Litchfieldella xinjiangensis]|uniref:glycosyltransferase family 2 protein n=1 Tax=Litchfieldella xinjiangensis TaxID=1166948 RepID=UPI0009DF6BB9|nr:glycosyltransferase family 2 protein [Halomonas xinjiangensis]